MVFLASVWVGGRVMLSSLYLTALSFSSYVASYVMKAEEIFSFLI